MDTNANALSHSTEVRVNARTDRGGSETIRPPDHWRLIDRAWNSECCFELFASQQEIISKGHNGNGRAKTSLR
jgi:hypothetical protein